MVDYFIRVADDGTYNIEEFWAVDDGVAYQNIIPSEFGTHRPDGGKDILSMLRDRFPESRFHKLNLGPGEYYPRMARPSSIRPECSPGRNPDSNDDVLNNRTTSTWQLHALIQDLQRICQVVHPIETNFCAYGHQIRNVTILACTKVEAHLKNILAANSLTGETRRDYVRLSAPMKLGAYRVKIRWYPWLEAIAPFEGWVETALKKKRTCPGMTLIMR